MPPTRTSGRANTSRGRTRDNGAGQGSSSRGVKAEAGGGRDEGEGDGEGGGGGGGEGEEETATATAGGSRLDEIHRLLQDFDSAPEPLRAERSEAKLKQLRNDWASMEGNFEIAYQLITQVAERLAEARSMEGIVDEDENLQELDIGMRGMIDLQENVKHRRQALGDIRIQVGEGGLVTDASAVYKSSVAQLDDEYGLKSVRQRYGHSKVYSDYKKAVWGALREDDMPPLVDLLPHDANGAADDDDDDDVVAYGGDRQRFKCPLSLHVMVEPLKSTVCQHAFEKSSILSYLGNATKQCPTGCSAQIKRSTLVADPVFTRACQKYARREASRRERDRTQAQATMLD